MQTPETRHTYRYGNGIFPALLVIAIGVLFLLHNFGVDISFLEYHNWWALFILVAAAAPLTRAAEAYRAQRKIDAAVVQHLCTAAAIVTVALFFLLEISWQHWWPVFMIYGGVCMLAKNWKGGSGSTSP